MEQGGTPEELYFRPRTLFTAGFLGESNILTGEVAGVEGETVVVGAGGAKLRAPREPGLKDLGRVALMVRPERVAIQTTLAFASDKEAHNAVEGVLRDVILVGGVTKYYVTLDDGQNLVASTLTGDAKSLATPGSRVWLRWPVASTVVLSGGSRGP